MEIATVISVILIAVGALFLILATALAMKIVQLVPFETRNKWLICIGLTIFFIIGYLMADLILISSVPIPLELVTGFVFVGGAVYVYVIVNLSRTTIEKVRKMDEVAKLNKQLKGKNKELKAVVDEMVAFSAAIDEVSKGNFEVEVPKIESHPDLKALSPSFTRMLTSVKLAMKELEENYGENKQ